MHRAWLANFTSLFASRMLAAAAAFLATVLMAKDLGPAGFGVLSILLAVLNVVSGLAAPALDMTTVRFASRHGVDQPKGGLPYFQALLRIKSVLILLLFGGGLLLTKPLAWLLFPGEAQPPIAALCIAFVAATLTMLWGFAYAYLQARQRFRLYAAFEVANATVRLFLVLFLIYKAYHSTTYFMATYALSAGLMALLSWPLLPRGCFRGDLPLRPYVRELLHFAKWVLVASVTTTLAQRADIFLLALCSADKVDIGHYGAAVSLTLVGDLLGMSLFNVLLPGASQIQDLGAMRQFLRRAVKPTLAACAGMLPLILLCVPITRLTFGPDYHQTGYLFAILLSGSAVGLLAAPAGAAIYSLGRPHVIAALETLKLALILLAGYTGYRLFGLVGLACGVSAAKGTLGLVTYAIAWRLSGGAGSSLDPSEDIAARC